jgi:hypothetical protein
MRADIPTIIQDVATIMLIDFIQQKKQQIEGASLVLPVGRLLSRAADA